METAEFYPITEATLASLLDHGLDQAPEHTDCRRTLVRWPFPGTVQLWLPEEHGEEQVFGTCLNLSHQGLGILCDDPLPVGTSLTLAIHQPEMSFQGQGVVRHCTEIEAGYFVGVQFEFSDQP
jgi:hypothetical protein